MHLTYVLLSALAALTFPLVAGHGILMKPSGRSSAWRNGFPTPVNNNDNQLFCGGFQHQQSLGGKCGMCGDPYDQHPRENEAGGKYATGTIVGWYNVGAVMPVTVQITANHLGWFEFRLCPNNDVTKPITQECLDKYLLPLADGSGTRLPITGDMFWVNVNLQLPAQLSCTQCVLQWKWNTGNNWGTDPVTGETGKGFGPQEQFYGCADISIGHGRPTTTATTTLLPTKTTRSTAAPPPTSRPTSPTSRPTRCWAVNEFAGDKAMDQWCEENCVGGFCPPSNCKCQYK